MIKITATSRRLRSAIAAAGFVAAGFVAPAVAQEATTIQELLRQQQQQREQIRQENRRREQEFRNARDQQQTLLRQALERIQELEAESDRLEGVFNENETRLAELQQLFQERQGEFGELFGVARQVAGETASQLENSLISSQYPNRETRLREIAQTDSLPSFQELERIWKTIREEIEYQGQVVRYQANVLNAEGAAESTEVVRAGPFVVVNSNGYMQYNGATQKLRQLPRQPSSAATGAANRLFNADSGDDLVKTMVDPSRGAILSVSIEAPTLFERFKQGKEVGYVVSGLAVVGIIIGIWRLVVLFFTQGAVRRQARNPENPSESNALGRIIRAYQQNAKEDVETMELRLDEAILKETPKLEFGLNTLKVLAAVAPLMGLLGTVVGMIQTFQQITLFGTGDPKIMAGGISQALVTTVLGLVAAIPLLLLHSFASSSARSVGQILEEQAAGLVAEHAEKHGKRAA